MLAAVAKVFGDNGVSIRSMEQEGCAGEARLMFVTHSAREGDVRATLDGLAELDAVGADRRRDADRGGGPMTAGAGSAAWRGVIEEYRQFLPVSAATPVVTLLEGGTPLLPAPRLSARVGARVAA